MLPKNMTDKESKKKDTKVFKMEELDADNGFLSGLGFAEPKKTVEKKVDNVLEPLEDEDMTKFYEEKTIKKTFEKAPERNPFESKPFQAKKIEPKAAPVQRKSTYERRPYTGKMPEKKVETKTFVRKTIDIKTQDKPRTPFKPQNVNNKTQDATKFKAGGKDAFKKSAAFKKGKGNDLAKGHEEDVFDAEGVLLNPKNVASQRPKKEYSPQTSSTLKKKIDIKISDTITVKEFSEKMGVALPEVMKKLLMNKIIVNANSSIDYETANLIGEEFGVKVLKDNVSVSLDDLLAGNLASILAQDKEAENLENRPPVVTIMGHVDHGKTKLLDYIRKTNVVSGEAGGITQSIGASQFDRNGQKITFVDTPGHELFTSMRARGAKVTDIVVIVIAADEGTKQQTVEAINHAKEAGVPIIVAATKIDKPNTNLDMIKGQMAEHGLTPEEWGGNVPLIPLSAVTGQGVDDLLDMILLQAEMLDLRYNPARGGVGIVLEAHKDAKKGVTTSLILMTGTLKVGDVVSVHDNYGKVKKMVDWKGKDVDLVRGGDPVLILGISDVPSPGRMVEVMKSEKDAQIKIDLIKRKEANMQSKAGIQNIMDRISKGETALLKLIVKSDSYGSMEALKYTVGKIPVPENVDIKIIHSDLGDISDGDLILADASDAIVIGFNVNLNQSLIKKAEEKKIQVKSFDIIYEIIDYVERLAKGMVKVEEKEVQVGKLNVLGVFFKKGSEMIVGGQVAEGKVHNGNLFRIERAGEIVGGGRVTSLRKGDEQITEGGAGLQVGMRVKINKNVEVNDVLNFYVME